MAPNTRYASASRRLRCSRSSTGSVITGSPVYGSRKKLLGSVTMVLFQYAFQYDIEIVLPRRGEPNGAALSSHSRVLVLAEPDPPELPPPPLALIPAGVEVVEVHGTPTGDQLAGGRGAVRVGPPLR